MFKNNTIKHVNKTAKFESIKKPLLDTGNSKKCPKQYNPTLQPSFESSGKMYFYNWKQQTVTVNVLVSPFKIFD